MVDDGSTGTSMKLCEAAESDPRIRYVLQTPSGPAAARNNGIRHATGSYLSFLDSDDLFTPDKLARQLAFMEENQFAISHTSYQRMTIDGKDGEVMHSASLRGAIFPSVIGRCTIAMPTVMGRREVFAHLSFPENNEIGEDVCLWIELSVLHEWGGLDEPLTRVRISDQSCALNPRKQVIGLLNISLYCMRRDHLACHPDSIQKLVLAANRLLENRPPSVAGSEAPAPESVRNDLAEIADRSSNPRLDNGHALDTLYKFPSKVSKEFGRAMRKLRRALQG
jgi:glycosyltransferase involved in cell wall biosynthesis